MEPKVAMDNKKPEGDNGDKELKRLFESYVKVLEHKLGHTPTAEEVAEYINTKPQESDPNTGKPIEPLSKPENASEKKPVVGESQENSDDSSIPKILKYMIYYGMKPEEKGKDRELDPNCALYYGDDGAGRTFDVQSKQWLTEKPAILGHLHTRPLDDRKSEAGVSIDVLQAILHGVMDDDDYSALDKVGAIDPVCKGLWEKVSILKKNIEALDSFNSPKNQLEKSSEFPVDNGMEEEDPWVAAKYARQSQQPEEEIPLGEDDDYSPLDDAISEFVNIPEEFLSTTGGENQVGLSEVPSDTLNAVQEMVKVALDKALTGRLAEQIEITIRKVLAEKDSMRGL